MKHNRTFHVRSGSPWTGDTRLRGVLRRLYAPHTGPLVVVMRLLCSAFVVLLFLWLFPAAGGGLRGFQAASAATDPVIAAAGDIACDPASASFNNGLGTSSSCRQKYTSDLLVNAGLAAVLDLGDNQYYCGGYQAFLQSYDLSWGRIKSITHPSVGNHEYLTSGGTGCDTSNAGAAGYYKYFGSAAGVFGQGYYSFNVGAWHIIALNSNCGDAGGCGPGTPQYTWLKSDLATHSNYCTLAYWHIPLFSSGGRSAANSQSFWNLLYSSNADLILNGHDHIYERFAPQSPTGTADSVRGIREFTVGTGGANHTSITTIAANSQVHNADTYGVLKLTLHSTGYDWLFVHENGKTFADSGTGSCHGILPTPTPQGSVLFSDGFESGNLSQWTTVQGLAVQSQVVANGSYAARGTTTGGGATYARKQLSSPQSNLYYRILFKMISQGANTVNLMKFRTSTDAPILSVSVSNTGKLGYRNDVTGVSVNSSVAVSPGSWQTLQVHLRIADTSSQVEVWFNGAPVSTLTRTDSFGTIPIGRIQLGENTTGLVYDVAFDDVVASLGYIDGSATPQPTTTATPTKTSTPAPTSASTATATFTPLPTPTPGVTATPTTTSASGPSVTFTPNADAYVNSGNPANNYGSTTTLRADGSPDLHSYVRFTVSGLNGSAIKRVRLLFYMNSSSSAGMQALAVSDNTWSEKTITYSNAPVLGSTIATSGGLTGGTWVTLDVSSYVTAERTYSFGIITPGSTAISFASRESGANAPRLIVDLGP